MNEITILTFLSSLGRGYPLSSQPILHFGKRPELGRHSLGGISEKRVESMLLCPEDHVLDIDEDVNEDDWLRW